MVPVWLLDIDGVINAVSRKPPKHVWPEDQWTTGKARDKGRNWPMLGALPVMEFIRRVHETGQAEIRWHTTWQDKALEVGEMFGLPEFAVAKAPEFLERETDVWWKLPAAERVVREECRPLIWADDDITWSLAHYDVDAELRAHAPALLISPDETTGLMRKHLRQISDFLAHHRLDGEVA